MLLPCYLKSKIPYAYVYFDSWLVKKHPVGLWTVFHRLHPNLDFPTGPCMLCLFFLIKIPTCLFKMLFTLFPQYTFSWSISMSISKYNHIKVEIFCLHKWNENKFFAENAWNAFSHMGYSVHFGCITSDSCGKAIHGFMESLYLLL